MKYTIIFLLLLKTSFVLSQNEYLKSIDSLNVLLKFENNTSKKINHLNNLCNIYYQNDQQEFVKYNSRLLDFSKLKNDNKGYGYYFMNNAKLFFIKDQPKDALIESKKALDLFYKTQDWDNYFEACADFATFLIQNEQMDKAAIFLKENIKLAIQKKSSRITGLYIANCRLYNFKSDYKKALFYANKAVSSKINLNDKIKIYNYISHIYSSIGNFSSATEYNNLSFKLAKSPLAILQAKIVQIEILYNSKKYQETLLLTLETLEFIKKNRILKPDEDLKFKISKCYYKLGKYNLANKYIDIILKEPFKRKVSRIARTCHKANICFALKDNKSAILNIDKCIALLKEEYFFELKLQVYQVKVKIEQSLRNYETAFYYQNKILEIKEKNVSSNNLQKLNQLQIDFEIAEKNAKISNFEVSQLKKKMEIKQKNNFLLFVFSLLIFLIMTIIFFLHKNSTIRLKNKIISRANKKLELEKNKTQKSLFEKETLLKEVHHRVKNNLQLVMSLLYVQSKQKNIGIAEFLEISQSRILSMALIHENLYQSEDLNKVDFNEYTKNLTQSILNSYNNSNQNIELKLDLVNIYLDIQIAIPLGIIINELVINALKHAFLKDQIGIISIKISQKNNNFELIVSDNGTGIIESNEKNKNSIGLELVNQLVGQIEGVMDIQNISGMTYKILFTTTQMS